MAWSLHDNIPLTLNGIEVGRCNVRLSQGDPRIEVEIIEVTDPDVRAGLTEALQVSLVAPEPKTDEEVGYAQGNVHAGLPHPFRPRASNPVHCQCGLEAHAKVHHTPKD